MSCAPWPPPRRGKPLFVLVPSSVIANEPGLILKTVRASEIARVAALFRADRIIAYKGKGASREDLWLFRTLLGYAVTPPHLKKEAYPLDERLRYAGMMKPLQTPAHHPPERLERGSVVAGLVERCLSRTCIVSFGSLGRGEARYSGPRPRKGGVVAVRIVRPPRGRIPARGEIFEPAYYWNPKVSSVGSLPGYLRELRDMGFLIVGTSRLGRCAGRGLARAVRGAKGVAVVFGGPRTHVWDEAPRSLFDVIVNTVPLQGTRTVRTEEAILATLSVLDTVL